jgi:hypothetical protein
VLADVNVMFAQMINQLQNIHTKIEQVLNAGAQ